MLSSSAGAWQSSSFQTAQNGMGDPHGITDITGGGGAHNNMPPYVTVYMWVRTA